MTVRDLIARLQTLPDDADVTVVHPPTGETFPISGVWLSEGSPDDDEAPVVELTPEGI